MRNMSFVRTINQIQNRTQTVTRRLGWKFLKPGDLIRAVEKQALKAGETVKPLAVLRVINVRRERLADMIGNMRDVELEGFTGMTSMSFVLMFCDANRPCKPDWQITRIEFEYVDEVSQNETEK